MGSLGLILSLQVGIGGVVASTPDRLCNPKLLELARLFGDDSTKPYDPILFPNGVATIVDPRDREKNERADGPTLLVANFDSIPAIVLDQTTKSEIRAEAKFREIMAKAGLPYAYHLNRGGHSYADVGIQERTLNAPIPTPTVRAARSLMLRFLHVYDDAVDDLVARQTIRVDLGADFESLVRSVDPRLLKAYDLITNEILQSFNGEPGDIDFEDYRNALRRTTWASVMFAGHTLETERRRLQARYKQDMISQIEDDPELARFVASLSSHYVSYASKVVMEGFSTPMALYVFEPMPSRVRSLSFLMDLLYLPALALANRGAEVKGGDVCRAEKLKSDEISETLERVIGYIAQLPTGEKEFVLKNFRLFLDVYRPILERIQMNRTEESLFKRFFHLLWHYKLTGYLGPQAVYRDWNLPTESFDSLPSFSLSPWKPRYTAGSK